MIQTNTQQKNNNALNSLINENKGIPIRYMTIKNRCIYKKIVGDGALIEFRIPLYYIYNTNKLNENLFREMGIKAL